LKALALAGAKEWTVVTAAHQTAGKGRAGRAFLCESGKGLYMSVLLRPKLPLARANALTLMAGVSAAHSLAALTGASLRLKWPNDVFLNGKKIAGILTESRSEGADAAFVIIGVGVNVSQTSFDGLPFASSLLLETRALYDVKDVRESILSRLRPMYVFFLTAGAASFLPEYRRLCDSLGKETEREANGAVVAGTAEDVDDEGALRLRLSGGNVIRLFS
jgi:BirA family biotin operon repressor/biotin-[acetyl-CoA-carboxylase] ligase